jgi:hypothetical protein
VAAEEKAKKMAELAQRKAEKVAAAHARREAEKAEAAAAEAAKGSVLHQIGQYFAERFGTAVKQCSGEAKLEAEEMARMEKAAAAFINAAAKAALNTWIEEYDETRLGRRAPHTHNPSPTLTSRSSLYYRYKSKLKLRAAAKSIMMKPVRAALNSWEEMVAEKKRIAAAMARMSPEGRAKTAGDGLPLPPPPPPPHLLPPSPPQRSTRGWRWSKSESASPPPVRGCRPRGARRRRRSTRGRKWSRRRTVSRRRAWRSHPRGAPSGRRGARGASTCTSS